MGMRASELTWREGGGEEKSQQRSHMVRERRRRLTAVCVVASAAHISTPNSKIKFSHLIFCITFFPSTAWEQRIEVVFGILYH